MRRAIYTRNQQKARAGRFCGVHQHHSSATDVAGRVVTAAPIHPKHARVHGSTSSCLMSRWEDHTPRFSVIDLAACGKNEGGCAHAGDFLRLEARSASAPPTKRHATRSKEAKQGSRRSVALSALVNMPFILEITCSWAWRVLGACTVINRNTGTDWSRSGRRPSGGWHFRRSHPRRPTRRLGGGARIVYAS
jgi:hypothetical protein